MAIDKSVVPGQNLSFFVSATKNVSPLTTSTDNRLHSISSIEQDRAALKRANDLLKKAMVTQARDSIYNDNTQTDKLKLGQRSPNTKAEMGASPGRI